MEYYIYMIEIEGSLRRVDMNSSPVVLERWDDGKWIFSPETIAVTGLEFISTRLNEPSISSIM